MKKNFVLDTNVLLHDSSSIYNFQENDIYLPIAVLEELDKFKKGAEQLNYNARSVVRDLDTLAADGIKGTVEVTELMGSSVHVHINTEGKDIIAIVPTSGQKFEYSTGTQVSYTFNGDVAHVFDKDGNNLEF